MTAEESYYAAEARLRAALERSAKVQSPSIAAPVYAPAASAAAANTEYEDCYTSPKYAYYEEQGAAPFEPSGIIGASGRRRRSQQPPAQKPNPEGGERRRRRSQQLPTTQPSATGQGAPKRPRRNRSSHPPNSDSSAYQVEARDESFV